MNQKKLLSSYYRYSWHFRMINLSVEDKIVVFKMLAISKLVCLSLLTVIPNHVTDEVAKYKNLLYGMIHPLKLSMKH